MTYQKLSEAEEELVRFAAYDVADYHENWDCDAKTFTTEGWKMLEEMLKDDRLIAFARAFYTK